jgi:hypothetical protein
MQFTKAAQMKSSGFSLQAKKWVINAALILAMIVQVYITVEEFILPLQTRIQTVSELSAIDRSAYLSFGDNFAESMKLLRSWIPQDAAVVVPPMEADEVYGNSALMAYFLYPRTIKHCKGDESFRKCFDRYAGEAKYFLSAPNYTLKESEQLDAVWKQVKSGIGVYVIEY